MRITFQSARQHVIWNFPMFKKEDEDTVMDWAEKNKINAEGINGVAQLVRLIQAVVDSQSKRR